MQNLHEKVAVITGGASGIGKAMAERFAREGMHLVLVDIEKDRLDETASAIRAGGTRVLAEIVDVAEADDMDALGERVLAEFGAVHVVCNNAGVASAGPMWELTTADWEFTMRPNLWGVIHGVRVFGPPMVAQDEGHFVNTASMAGLVSAAGMGPYNVTKHGVVTLSETLFADLANAGSQVGVSVLCPAFVQTRIWDSERNRPEHLQNPAAHDRAEEREGMRQMLKAVIESSMPVAQVAERVLEAILAKQLYILTHEGTAPAVEKRMQHILKGENPTVTPLAPENLTK